MPDDCIFCKILKGEIPSDKVYEDDFIYAFNDITPQSPVHTLIIPKKHINGINDIGTENTELIQKMFSSVPEIANIKGIKESGYRVIINSGPDGLQTVPHIHIHILGGRKLKWPPG
ncbi:MAG: histidine triad nucleotide-binding protein [Fibrobacterota bacterium]